MNKWMRQQTKEQRLDFARSELYHKVDRRGRHCWYIINKGMGDTRISAERAQDKLKPYGLTLEDFINGVKW